MVDNVIDWINLYLVNGAIGFPEFICWIVICPVDSATSVWTAGARID